MIYAFRLDANGHMTMPYASPAFERILGIAPEALARDADAIMSLIPEEDAVLCREHLAHSAATLAPWNDEFRVRHPDGRILWIEGRAVPRRDPDGGVTWHGFINDVTARHATQDSLRATQGTLQQSEQLHRDLVEMSPDAIFIQRGARLTFANAAGTALLGVQNADAVIGQDLGTFLLADETASGPDADMHTSHGFARPGRRRLRRSDGSVLSVFVAARSIPDEHGPAWQIVVHDLTAELARERSIAEREARLSSVINSAMDGIITGDDTHRVVLFNPAAERVFQRHADEVLGRPLDLLIPPRLQQRELSLVDAFVQRPSRDRSSHSRREAIGVRADGTEFPIEATISQVRVDGRQLFTVIARDVSEREQTARALRESDERFAELAGNIDEVFWLADPRRSTVQYVNPAFERIFGRAADELLREPDVWRQAIDARDRERVATAMRGMRRSGTFDVEYRIARPDGGIRWVRDRAVPVRDAEGQIIRLAGVAEDITERRELEAQLHQTQKLESIGELAGGVAHDFNNWLTVINGNCDLLLSGPHDIPSFLELIGEVRSAGDRAAALTRQLLAFSRQQVLEPRVLDVNAIVADTERMLRRLLGEDVILRTELRARGAIVADPGQVVQVLMNLAVNARDAMATGGTLRIETSDVDLPAVGALGRPARGLRISVSDTGCGMSNAVRERIFEPFFTTKGVGRGTRLGLSVVHGIVRQTGGSIDVQSELDQGTTFQITFPTASGEDSESTGPQRIKATGGTETILLVEDEELVRRIGARTLRWAGYTVVEATDGESALAILNDPANRFDLLVTDVVMPGIGGGVLWETVHKTHPGLRVLFTSGYTDDSVVRHGVMHADTAFLQKPYTVAAILAKIREVLDREITGPLLVASRQRPEQESR